MLTSTGFLEALSPKHSFTIELSNFKVLSASQGVALPS